MCPQKRYRRTASEIERRYKCPIENCQRAYGCEGSLNQHIKLKHPTYYSSQCQKPSAPSAPAQEEPKSESEQHDMDGSGFSHD